jgi:flagellar biosynthesis/type III secretory pathway protein FliH
LPLGDETYTIILNSKASDKASLPKPLQDLFQYMNTSIAAEDNEFLQQIDHSVEQWNTGEGRRMLMTLEQEILIKEARARREGHDEGYTEGHDEGFTEGHNKGSIETLVELVADGELSIEKGAKRANMTIEEFQEAVKNTKSKSE